MSSKALNAHTNGAETGRNHTHRKSKHSSHHANGDDAAPRKAAPPIKESLRLILDEVLRDRPDARASAEKVLASEGFTDAETWRRLLTDKAMELEVLRSVHKRAGLTLAQMAHLQQMLSAGPERPRPSDASSTEQPANMLAVAEIQQDMPRFTTCIWQLAKASFWRSYGTDWILSTAFNSAFFRATVLTNKSSDLKEQILGFCDTMTTMITLFVGGDVGLLGNDFDTSRSLDVWLISATAIHALLGTFSILNLVAFRITIARIGDANLQPMCLAMQPWFSTNILLVVGYIWTLFVLFALYLWQLTEDADDSVRLPALYAFCAMFVVMLPMTILPCIMFPRLAMESGSMDDHTSVLDVHTLSTLGPTATFRALRRITYNAMKNYHRTKDFSETYAQVRGVPPAMRRRWSSLGRSQVE